MTRFLMTMAAAVLFGLGWNLPAFAQTSGHVKVTFTKAGVVAGFGSGRGTLTYKGHRYRFTANGVSLGLTAGASLTRLEGRAIGLREIGDFAGVYSSVGGGSALVVGAGAVHLRNEKGVSLELIGLRAGMEFAANLGRISISLVN